MRRRVLALGLALSLGAPSVVAATWCVCRFDDCVIASPCCDESPTPLEASWRGAPCCDDVRLRLSRATSQRPDDPVSGVSFAAILVRADVVTPPSPSPVAPPTAGRAPPGSIRIRQVSLLL